VLVVAQAYLAVDYGSQEARPFLLQAPGTSGEIVHQFGHQRRDPLRIKDNDVGGPALAQ
jgi:hypothetical protein